MKTKDTKYTKEEFLTIAKNNGYDIFDFSKIEYKNLNSHLLVHCPVHGWTYIYAYKFLTKRDNPLDVCLQCYNNHNHCGQKYSNEEFIEKIKNIHKDKTHLCFDKVYYINAHEKVIVTCKKHGDFSVQAAHLLEENYDCKFCKKENKRYEIALKKYNTFLIKAKNKWPNIDYTCTQPSLSPRNNIYEINCAKHGKQKVIDTTFLRSGCPKCNNGLSYENINRNYTTEEFIQELKDIYEDKFDYSQVNYINWKTKVKLKCHKHGWFYREPVRLLKEKRGCPYCSKSLIENDVATFLTNNNIKYIREYTPNFLDKKRLDFYLPDFNIGIECQGRQHFYQNSRYNENACINNVIENDKCKFETCKENGLTVFYYTNIRYNETYFTELITDKNELLNQILKLND